ncbi:cytochrome b/b6 domain-containing protein [Roseomonas sp. NAR14]|uniref:Cytochrome b/b6 domain-containing protein n=1 Tax=Roseomonas acroporae TaxID=2937791 RepID=A0A9X1YCU5_9PROT|nr:cytochrome b/b6 domain-containing protein [Roseomonas acroporae]MCK8786362.1 cytochrome b/b6 domain-containing protein [Roseomonas acroporae]
MQALHRVKVWDGWVRLFHWSIVLLVGASWLTYEKGWMELHLLSGYVILALLLFRVAWGFVGSDTARFARFLRSPLAALRHLGEFRHRGPDTEIGHNAAGGWMVLVMLGLLLFQAGTGLFSNDQVFTSGPLARFVSGETSDRLSGLHARNFNLILAAVALHVLAVLAYALLRRHDLVRPMVTGWKKLPAGAVAPRLGRPALAAGLLAGSAAIVWLIASLG